MNKKDMLNKKVEVLKSFLDSEEKKFDIFERKQNENKEIINQNFIDLKQEKRAEAIDVNKKQ